MDLQLVARGVYPEAGTVRRHRNVFHAPYEDGLAAVDTVEQFADVQMQMTLRSNFNPIVSHSPVVTPKFLGFGDGGPPELGTFGGAEMPQLLHDSGMQAGGPGEEGSGV